LDMGPLGGLSKGYGSLEGTPVENVTGAALAQGIASLALTSLLRLA